MLEGLPSPLAPGILFLTISLLCPRTPLCPPFSSLSFPLRGDINAPPHLPPSVASPSLCCLGPQHLTFHVQVTFPTNFLKKVPSITKKRSDGKCYNNLLFLFPYKKNTSGSIIITGSPAPHLPASHNCAPRSFSSYARGKNTGGKHQWPHDSSP